MRQAARAALLRLIDEAERSGQGGAALPFYATPADEIATFASDHELDLSFVYLVMTFATGETAVWRQIVEALPEAADTRLAAVGWIEWLWRDPEIGFRARVHDAALAASGDAVCGLHRRTAAGEVMERRAWRQARASLDAAAEGGETQAAAMEGIAAAAWDLGSSPGAATDMIYPWKTTLFTEIGLELSWNEEKQKASNERIDHMVSAARAGADAEVEAARRSGNASFDEVENVATTPFYQEAYSKAANEFLTANPSDLDRYGERTRAAVADMYRWGREGLLKQIELLTPVG